MINELNISSLIVSPNASQGKEFKNALDCQSSHAFTLLHSFAQAREAFQSLQPDLAIIDITSDQDQGLELIKHIRQCLPHTVCFAFAPLDERDIHFQALQSGAHTILPSPLRQEELNLIVSNFFSTQKESSLSSDINLQLRDSDGFCGIAGASPPMHHLFRLIDRLGKDGESTVLIQGESGVGKELVARALHKCSFRANNNFVPVNCSAIPDTLLESELFGHEKGAFTGATQNKKGRLHHAHGGTLFLDEIGEMQPGLQAKLLRVLQEREFEPIGSVRPVKIDTRVIAATNIDLEQAVQNSTFRTDLYYRLSVIPLHIPPLRKRPEDIPLLLRKFALLFNRGKRGDVKDFTPEVIEVLKNYSWPGNVRELKNLAQRLCVLHQGKIVKLHDLPEEIRVEGELNAQQQSEDDFGALFETLNTFQYGDQEIDFNNHVSDFEDRLILQALIATNGNKKQAAKKLRLKRTTLLEKIKKKGLDYKYSLFEINNVNIENK